MAIQNTRPQHARPTYQQQPQHQERQQHRQQDDTYYPFKARAIAQRVRDMKAAIEDLARMGLVEVKKPLSSWRAELVAIMDAMAAGTRREPAIRAERMARVDSWIAQVGRAAMERLTSDEHDDADTSDLYEDGTSDRYDGEGSDDDGDRDDDDLYYRDDDGCTSAEDEECQAYDRELERQIDVALELEEARLLRGGGDAA